MSFIISGPQTPETRLLTQRIQQLEGVIAQQVAHIKKCKDNPMGVGAVISITKTHVMVARGSDIHRLVAPAAFVTEDKISAGDRVVISNDGLILGRVDVPTIGRPVTVKSVLENGYEVTSGQDSRVVAKGSVVAEVGHRIVLDPGDMVAIATLGPQPSPMEVSPDVRVSWDDIGGQVEAKRKLREAIIDPIQNAETLREFGVKTPKGVLLHGPPGVGKTLLAKAVATALAELHGETAGSFIYVKGPEIVSKWVGETESNIRDVFKRSREFFRATGQRCVVFIDEADAVMGKRGQQGGDPTVANLQRSIIAAFLAEMDGMQDSGAIVILATNRPGDLDSAVTRDGRIDEKIEVTRPTLEDCVGIFEINLRGKKLNGKAYNLSRSAAASLFDESRIVRKTPSGIIRLSSIVSGSLISGIVQKATRRAVNSALDGGKTNKIGISVEHLDGAIEESCQQNKHINHEWENA